VGDYGYGLAYSHRRRASLHDRVGETHKAVKLVGSAIETLDRLVANNPAVGRYRDELVNAYMQLARLKRRDGELTSAIAAASKAIETAESPVAAGMRSSRYVSVNAINRSWRGDTYVLLGKYDQAKTDYHRAIDAADGAIDKARAKDWRGRLAAISHPSKWQVKFYDWRANDDLTRPDVWTELLTRKPLAVTEIDALHIPRQSTAPAKDVPADYFALVAQTELELNGGEYNVALWADDGARLFVDGELVLDRWKTRATATRSTATLRLPAGKHALKVEFFKATGDARLTLALTARR
jgi:tetratricopeptide (TPR) repeat protein